MAFGPFEETNPLMVDIEMTGPGSASYDCIWHGTTGLEPEPPVPVGAPDTELVFIDVAKGTTPSMGPGQATAVHYSSATCPPWKRTEAGCRMPARTRFLRSS